MGKIKVLGLMSYFLLAVGCASIVSLITEGSTGQNITFNSDPPGVQLLAFGDEQRVLGVTPLTVELERAKGTFVVAKHDGYKDKNIHLRHHFNYWFWGNIICCGLLGSTTDGISSETTVEYDPDEYFITMKQTNASIEESQRWQAKMEIRNFLLYSYDKIAIELVRGEGEYLLSLYKLLGIENKTAQKQSFDQLKIIYKESKNIPDFAQEVLGQFYSETV